MNYFASLFFYKAFPTSHISNTFNTPKVFYSDTECLAVVFAGGSLFTIIHDNALMVLEERLELSILSAQVSKT